MSRGLWFVAGAGAGIYAMVRGRRAAEAVTVDGFKDRLGAAAVGARMLRDEVAQGKAEAETGLRERLGLVPHGLPELASPPTQHDPGEHAPAQRAPVPLRPRHRADPPTSDTAEEGTA